MLTFLKMSAIKVIMKIDYAFILISNVIILNLISVNAGPVVTTENGPLEGVTYNYNGTELNRFMGIPYVEPPVGELRFKKPVPKRNWTGIYSAIDIKSICGQVFVGSSFSEDCLFLNIWSMNISKEAEMPVMLWIHGGALYYGYGAIGDNETNPFDGTVLAMNGVVIVTVNYRLGVFGFLFCDSDDCPGNVGHWDQVYALKWVKNNIRAFGGNPNKITVFGESAGAWSISSLIISPVAKNLFNQGIIQSGTSYIRRYMSDKKSAFINSRDFATNTTYFGENACIDNTWVKCLKNMTAQQLVDAEETKFFSNLRNIILFLPIYGDKLIPHSPPEAIKNGYFKKDIKLLIGHNEMEGVFFNANRDTDFDLRYNPFIPDYNISKETAKLDIEFQFFNKSIGKRVAQKYVNPFLDKDLQTQIGRNALRRAAVHSFGDYLLACPTIVFGANIVKYRKFVGKVFQYRLTYANSKSLVYTSVWADVTHGDDIQLVFGRPLVQSGWTELDQIMSSVFVYVWTYFAKHGYPPKVNFNEWPQYCISYDGSLNASYLELNPKLDRLGRVCINCYKGNDGYFPSAINKCLNFWNKILKEEFNNY